MTLLDRRRKLWSEVASGRPWRDRAIVLAYAVGTGLVVVAFTLLAEVASAGFETLVAFGVPGKVATLAWTPLVTVALLWCTLKFAPGAQGSGIPQVVAALDDDLPAREQSRLVSLRIAVWKIVLVSGGLLAGLSIGREGPTVQVGAGVMQHAGRWLGPSSAIDAHDLMVAGAAAGIAAAFNTPLGGIIFALEQLSRRRSFSHTGLVITAIVLAGLVAVSAFGNATYFGELRVQALDWSYLLPGCAVALASGLSGGLFSHLIVASARGASGPLARLRALRPFAFAAACGLVVAIIGLASGGATAGAGYAPTRALLEGGVEPPAIYTVLKLCATWISAWSGVPAGVFAPSLAIGAGVGRDVAAIAGFAGDRSIPLIALGMVGFLAASTQGPLTAFIIVMEMVSGHAMVLSLMATAFLASGVSRLLTPPMFSELAAVMIASLRIRGPQDAPSELDGGAAQGPRDEAP
ncbi:MAG TPA: chloride channel protein [Casimicrobiaceae bacterium]|nr:chloride channel protein [Casimicrobiaceae bacterium]